MKYQYHNLFREELPQIIILQDEGQYLMNGNIRGLNDTSFEEYIRIMELYVKHVESGKSADDFPYKRELRHIILNDHWHIDKKLSRQFSTNSWKHNVEYKCTIWSKKVFRCIYFLLLNETKLWVAIVILMMMTIETFIMFEKYQRLKGFKS